ncbi:MAG: hypothetical protein C0434_08105 [Xanthomonadaceae bacterium]|nr:hypothetical protein [Xanthomonadaceae bacterium]
MALNPNIYSADFSAPPAAANPNAGTLQLSRNSNTYANDLLGVITRDQYRDYLRNFYGIEDEILKYATDDTQPLKSAQEAQRLVSGSFDAVAGQIDRRNRRMGISLNADQQQAQQRSLAIQKGLSTTAAMNRASTSTYDRQNALLTGARSQSQNFAAGLKESPQ